MHENVVSGLIRRRRELALEADTVRARYDELLADVAALDRSILIFRPEADLEAIPALAFTRKADWAKRGEIARAILSVFRDATGPVSTPDIVALLLGDETLHLSEISPRLANKRVHKALSRMRDQGLVANVETRGGQYLEWEIARIKNLPISECQS